MKPRVYIETTIPSYLTARPSRSVIVAARQQETRDWWAALERYEAVTSQLVLDECADGDPDAAADRLAALAGMALLDITPFTDALTKELLVGVRIPAKAAADAGHIALAAVHGVTYLVTWNCRHLANAAHRRRVEAICRAAGCVPPAICTPPELTGRMGDV